MLMIAVFANELCNKIAEIEWDMIISKCLYLNQDTSIFSSLLIQISSRNILFPDFDLWYFRKKRENH